MIEALADVMVIRGLPQHLCSDNGPEFVAGNLRKRLASIGAKTAYIEPESPWENGYPESFDSKLCDEFLNGEIFYSMKELCVLAERWRLQYNCERRLARWTTAFSSSSKHSKEAGHSLVPFCHPELLTSRENSR